MIQFFLYGCVVTVTSSVRHFESLFCNFVQFSVYLFEFLPFHGRRV